MSIQLYNTLTRRKEVFKPLDEANIRMYVCGPTVYDRAHLGNARSVVVYDVLYRLLRHLYPKVTYVRNITDVDDKINKAAKEQGIPIQQLTGKVTGWFHEDMAALNVLPPTVEPKATEHIGQMIEMIKLLTQNGKAYVAEGNVLFSVKTLPDYGKLSGRIQEDLDSGARIRTESYKRDPNDFVLWKPAAADDDKSSVFDSPWGKGRPGWHIECSAMSTEYLGHDFDIHGGGSDLMFPHHENEIAQSCGAYPHSHFARYWVHNGFLTVNGEKMAKSAGNFITVRDLLDKGVKGEVIRYALLSTKYNEPLDWNDHLLETSKNALDRFNLALRSIDKHQTQEPPNTPVPREVIEALLDDLNFPLALSHLHKITTDINNEKDKYKSLILAKKLMDCMELFGFPIIRKEAIELIAAQTQKTFSVPFDWSSMINSYAGTAVSAYGTSSSYFRTFYVSTDDNIKIQSLIDARIAAKKAKNWAEADRIRGELKAQGIILEDRPDGTTDWRRE